MDRTNYYNEYFLGNIDFDTLIKKVTKSIQDDVAYTMGAIDCAKYMYDYCDGMPIYSSEVTVILDKFLEDFGLSEEFRRNLTSKSDNILKKGTIVKALGHNGVVAGVVEHHGKLAYLVDIDGQVDCEVLLPENLEVIYE